MDKIEFEKGIKGIEKNFNQANGKSVNPVKKIECLIDDDLSMKPTEKLSHAEFLAQIKQNSLQAFDEVSTQKVKSHQNSALVKQIKRAAIPPRFKNKSFDNYVANNKNQEAAKVDCQLYADKFLKVFNQGICMVLTGNPGTGKTHLSIAVLNQLLAEGYSGLFITVSEMLRSIRATYSPASLDTEEQVFNRFIQTDCLVLDEVGVAIGNPEKRKALVFDLINGRYNMNKPTIIIGNLNAKEMESYLDIKVWDRIQENGAPVIVFDWDSYRRNQHG